MNIKTFLYSYYFNPCMLTDKEVKAEFKLRASKNPEKYYAVEVLKKQGFHRNKCKQIVKLL